MNTPSKELPTLLFTPRSEGREARTPHEHRFSSAQRSPSNLHGSSGLHSGQTRDGIQGPGGKRRSLTPTGSTPKEGAPAPPCSSLFDLSLGHTAVPPPDQGQQPAEGPADSSLNAAAGAEGRSGMQRDSAQELSRWVTIFGFNEEDLPRVLQEFQACGTILQFDSFSSGLPVNWVHIQFQTKYGAQRALLKNGEQLTKSMIIGVKTMEPRHLKEAASLEQEPSAAGLQPSPMLPARPHRVSAVPSAPVPKPADSTWSRITEALFG